ncbi:MAG: hypothetical protein Ta2E_11420 [Mycoplasmoidaceae bacterium]|nr:MAG: hypothetical protein Ta2E_11420 [Mycoplasmoidaceae bacterium]
MFKYFDEEGNPLEQNENLIKNVDQVKNENEELKKLDEEKSNQIKILCDEKELQFQSIQDLNDKIQSLEKSKEELNELKIKFEKANQDLDEKQQILDENLKRIEELEREIKTLKSKIFEQEKEIDQLQKESEGKENQFLLSMKISKNLKSKKKIMNNKLKKWQLKYAFDPIKFRDTCVQLLSLIVDPAGSIPIIEPKILPEMFRNVVLTLPTINEDEVKPQKNKTRILAVLDSALKSLDEYLQTYEIYADFIRLDHVKFNEQLNNDQPTLDQCKQEIKKHNDEIENLHRDVPKRVTVGLFAVNVTSVRNHFISKRRNLAKAILDYVSKTVKASFKKLLGEYHTIEAKILQEPKKIEELDQTRQYIQTVPATLEKLHVRVVDQFKFFDFLDDYLHPISQDDFNTKWIVYGRAKHCQGLIEKTKSQLDGFFVKFEQELEVQMERFQADLDKLSRDVSAISKYTDVSKCDTYHQEVRRVTKVIDAADKEAKQINGRQVIFHHELTNYSGIAELKKTFEPFSLLWPAVDQWVKIKQSIQDQPMIQLNADQTQEICNFVLSHFINPQGTLKMDQHQCFKFQQIWRTKLMKCETMFHS